VQKTKLLSNPGKSVFTAFYLWKQEWWKNGILDMNNG
jgi:hypothetical protein